MAIRFDYSRGGRHMSLRRSDGLLIRRTVLTVCALLAALPAMAQYPGQVSKNGKESPELRSVAVLEYTGDPGAPTASRLVPITVLDAGQLQDGGIYLARPEPLALIPEVEYELQQDGRPLGLFDIRNAGQVDGSWVGFGAWKPMPRAKSGPSAKQLAQTDFDDDAQSDTPVLHRKHHADDAPSGSAGSGSGSGSDSNASAEPSDPDRPVLKKKTTTGSTSNSTANASNPPASSGTATAGPDSSAGSTDSDRPVLKKGKQSQPATTGGAESAVGDSDPDRPRLKRGKSSGDDIEVAPSLKGFPSDVQQVVAVSDAKSRPTHPWNYTWSNPDDEAKMKSALEDMARDALGLKPPAKLAPTRAAAAKKSTKVAPPAPAAPLEGEQFRVFELSYGSGATLVLSAHTDGAQAQQKFVTLVAQPDLYGNVLTLLKNVTDGTHLDEKPRMRLVDAVDAMADNRGELLFELRGSSQRQFALYRVLRGRAERLFVTGGGEFGAVSSE
jgi:hypothetical protein